MKKKKKVIILTCMIALLAITAVFNFILTGTSSSTLDSDVLSSTDYFTKYREERASTRNESILQLDSIISSAEVGSETHSDALEMKLELTSMTEKEMLLETLIKAYGFDDVVVVMNLDNDSVNVIAKSTSLSTDDAIVIYNILQEESVCSPENVKIIPIS